MKKFTKSLLSLLVALLLTFTAVGCGEAQAKINLTEITEEVNFVTEKQQYLIDNYDKFVESSKLTSDYIYLGDDYASTEYSRPNPVKLSWTSENYTGNYTVEISETQDMKTPKTYSVEGATNLDVYNLKIGTKYYWRVKSSDGKTVSTTSTFTTKQVPIRTLYVDGLTNVRDIGGKTTLYGKTIKQGMLYRGARYTTNYTGEEEITEKGKDTLVNDLGLRTEIELRKNPDIADYTDEASSHNGHYENADYNEEFSVASTTIQYVKAPIRDEGNILALPTTSNQCAYVEIPSLKTIFETLADESNYPIYYHCKIGTDRTGGISYILGAILGLSEEQLQLDYCYSMLGNLWTLEERKTKHDRSIVYMQQKDWWKLINSTTGSTLQEKAINAVKAIGITDDQIKAFTRIMLGEEVTIPSSEQKGTPLTIGKNADACSKSGEFAYYKWKGSSACATFTVAPYVDEDNSVKFTIGTYTPSATTSNDRILIMYQPTGNAGEIVTISFDLVSSTGLKLTTTTDTTPYTSGENETLHRSFDYTITADTPLSLHLYFGDGFLNSGAEFTLSNFTCTPKTA